VVVVEVVEVVVDVVLLDVVLLDVVLLDVVLLDVVLLDVDVGSEVLATGAVEFADGSSPTVESLRTVALHADASSASPASSAVVRLVITARTVPDTRHALASDRLVRRAHG
jgi:hypothetical protein